jgi:pimeloyl-ACP methyl ester carboxylesterase
VTRPAVVLVSGQLLTAEFWTPQVAALSADFDFRLADHTRDVTVEAMASRLLAEAPDRFDLVAHAMGGFVALAAMRQAPERVRSLALLATMASADGPAQTARREGYVKLVEAGDFQGVVEERIPILVHSARREDAALLAIIRGMAEQTGAATFLRQQRAIMCRIDSRAHLSAIDCPVLILRGRQDAITSEDHQREMANAIGGARLETVEDCGHLLTLERPRTLSTRLAAWLGEPRSDHATGF